MKLVRPSIYVITLGDGFYKRSYNAYTGYKGTREQAATWRTREAAERTAERLRNYSTLGGSSYCATAEVVEVAA